MDFGTCCLGTGTLRKDVPGCVRWSEVDQSSWILSDRFMRIVQMSQGSEYVPMFSRLVLYTE